jgi:hypothetical protein
MSTNDDWRDEAGEQLVGLLDRASRAARTGMSDAESANVWQRVQQGRPRRAWASRWAWGVAAALLLAASLLFRQRSMPVEIVKQVRFETVQPGKAVRFEMIVYREGKEKDDAGKPPL